MTKENIPTTCGFKDHTIFKAEIMDEKLKLFLCHKGEIIILDWEFKDTELRIRLCKHLNKNKGQPVNEVLSEEW